MGCKFGGIIICIDWYLHVWKCLGLLTTHKNFYDHQLLRNKMSFFFLRVSSSSCYSCLREKKNLEVKEQCRILKKLFAFFELKTMSKVKG